MRVFLLKILYPILALTAFIDTFYGVIYYTFISVIRPEQLTYGTSQIPYVFAMAISCLVLACIIKKENLFNPIKNGFLFYFIWFLIAMYYSTLTSSYTDYSETRGSIYYVNQYPQIFAFCLCLYAVLTRLSEEQIQKYLKLLLFFFLFMGAWGIQQYFLGNILVERLFGGFIVDRCAICSVYVLYLPLAVYFARKKEKNLRIFGLLSIAVFTAIIVLGQSRAGFLGLCVTVSGMFFYARRKGKFIAVAGLALLIGIFLVPESYFERIQDIEVQDTSASKIEDSSSASRQLLWQVALEMIEDNPIKGVGSLNFSKASGKYGQQFKGEINEILYDYTFYDDGRSKLSHSHNTYLQVLVDGGILEAVPYYLMFLVPLWRGYRLNSRFKDHDNDRMMLVNLLSCGIVGELVTGIFGTLISLDYYFWNLTIIAFLIRQLESEHVIDEETGHQLVKETTYGST